MGKRALFGDPLVPAGRTAVDDRRALFASPAPERRSRLLTVECRECGSVRAVGVLPLALRLVPSLWLPLRRWNRFMRCPACGRYTWCRIGRTAGG